MRLQHVTNLMQRSEFQATRALATGGLLRCHVAAKVGQRTIFTKPHFSSLELFDATSLTKTGEGCSACAVVLYPLAAFHVLLHKHEVGKQQTTAGVTHPSENFLFALQDSVRALSMATQNRGVKQDLPTCRLKGALGSGVNGVRSNARA